MPRSYSKEINAATNRYITENYDRVQVIVPRGTKKLLRSRFKDGMTLNKYVNVLIDLDLRGRVEWGDWDEDFGVLRQMAATQES